MRKMKFKYQYINDCKKSKNIEVSTEGTTREELVENLISKQNALALFYFLRYFPDLSENIKDEIKKEILKIENISDIREIRRPEHIYLLTTESVYLASENIEEARFF